VNTPRCDEDSLEIMDLMVFLVPTLIDRKKVIITEDTTGQNLRLDDADGIDCLPNEEIFAELARIGYEKPIAWNEFSSSMALAVICLATVMINAQVHDLSSHNTKYTSPALIQKEFASMRRIGKGFLGVETPLFDAMLVQQQVHNDAKVQEDEDNNEIAQALKITKLKQRVRKLEKKRRSKSSGLKRGKIDELDADEDVTLIDVDAEDAMDANIQERMAESQAKVYHLDLQHSKKVLSMHDTDEAEPNEVEEVLKVVTATKLMTEVLTTAAPMTTAAQVPKASTPRKRRGIVIQDPEETAATLVIVHSEDNTMMRYQALKRKPVTEAQARKNMMVYLKNMARFKMEFFKGEEEVTVLEEGSKRKGENLEQDTAKKQRIDEEADELKAHLQIVANDDDDVYTEATPLALKNFDREDLEALWKLVKERFKATEPKNFSDDFLLNTFKIMFKKPNVEANMIILVEKKYLLTHFTLEQMLNNVRLEVKEESEMSLDLSRLVRRQLNEEYVLE
nr:hypothetical protein [Tanacetum cinerariifolium]